MRKRGRPAKTVNAVGAFAWIATGDMWLVERAEAAQSGGVFHPDYYLGEGLGEISAPAHEYTHDLNERLLAAANELAMSDIEPDIHGNFRLTDLRKRWPRDPGRPKKPEDRYVVDALFWFIMTNPPHSREQLAIATAAIWSASEGGGAVDDRRFRRLLREAVVAARERCAALAQADTNTDGLADFTNHLDSWVKKLNLD